MGLESVTLISDLNSANPAPGDNKAEGDDHIRNIKKALKNTFPNINKQITKNADALNADNRVKNAPYEQLGGTGAPMLEYHRFGQVAFATLIGSDNRWYLHGSNGSGGLTTPLFSAGPGGDVYFNNAITVANSIACSYARVSAPGAVAITMGVAGQQDRSIHRDSGAMGFLGLDGNWNLFSHNNGDLWVRGNISGFSDEKVKRDWNAISDDALARFARMRLCGSYANKATGVRHLGVSAQKFRKILPEAVTKNDGLYGVAYGQAALVLVHKLAQKVLELERRLAEHGL